MCNSGPHLGVIVVEGGPPPCQRTGGPRRPTLVDHTSPPLRTPPPQGYQTQLALYCRNEVRVEDPHLPHPHPHPQLNKRPRPRRPPGLALVPVRLARVPVTWARREDPSPYPCLERGKRERDMTGEGETTKSNVRISARRIFVWVSQIVI